MIKFVFLVTAHMDISWSQHTFFGFDLLFHSLTKAFNLKNSIFFFFWLLGLKVRLRQCFCGMKDFLEHWVPS